LSSASQGDLDSWLRPAPVRREVGHFVRWAASEKLTVSAAPLPSAGVAPPASSTPRPVGNRPDGCFATTTSTPRIASPASSSFSTHSGSPRQQSHSGSGGDRRPVYVRLRLVLSLSASRAGPPSRVWSRRMTAVVMLSIGDKGHVHWLFPGGQPGAPSAPSDRRAPPSARSLCRDRLGRAALSNWRPELPALSSPNARHPHQRRCAVAASVQPR